MVLGVSPLQHDDLVLRGLLRQVLIQDAATGVLSPGLVVAIRKALDGEAR